MTTCHVMIIPCKALHWVGRGVFRDSKGDFAYCARTCHPLSTLRGAHRRRRVWDQSDADGWEPICGWRAPETESACKVHKTTDNPDPLPHQLWNAHRVFKAPYWITQNSQDIGSTENKLAKARKTRTSPSTLGLKKFGLGRLWVKKVFWVKNVLGSKKFLGQKSFWVKKVF